MKDNIQLAREKTRNSVADITGWCMVVALHQRFGMGRDRLERLAGAIDRIQDEVTAKMDTEGFAAGMEMLTRRAAEITDPAFRVPLNRAPKGRREQQLRMAGDEAASSLWCCWALALHEVYGFGGERLARLKAETQENYRQFNGWAREDMRWAMEKLKHCAEQAMRDTIDIVDEPDPKPDVITVGQAEKQLAEQLYRAALRKARGQSAVNVLSDAARRAVAESIRLADCQGVRAWTK